MTLRSQEGSSTTEVTLVVPTALLMVLLVVQFALWYHASHVVTSAAQHGLSRLVTEKGSTALAAAEAGRFLQLAGGGVVQSPEVEVERGSNDARVIVRGQAVAVVPGLHLPVRAIAAGPIERFRSRGER